MAQRRPQRGALHICAVLLTPAGCRAWQAQVARAPRACKGRQKLGGNLVGLLGLRVPRRTRARWAATIRPAGSRFFFRAGRCAPVTTGLSFGGVPLARSCINFFPVCRYSNVIPPREGCGYSTSSLEGPRSPLGPRSQHVLPLAMLLALHPMLRTASLPPARTSLPLNLPALLRHRH